MDISETRDTPIYEATARALNTWPDAVLTYMLLPAAMFTATSVLVIGRMGRYLMFKESPICIPLDFQ
jgi:hypothetical protein